ncbi:MAG TPA: tetratricopeptide repeat protein [Terriglobia bacterium]|nr:tetratricopeptide repeat protein [Terriglobia bacterium]
MDFGRLQDSKVVIAVLLAVGLAVTCPGVEFEAAPATPNSSPRTAQESSASANPAELFTQAAELINKDRPGAAIPLLRKALQLAPREGRIHHYLGYALMKVGQQAEARKEFEEALKLEPDNPYTQYFLAQMLYSENQVDQAIRLYEKILASGEPLYDTYQRLGQAYARKGELAKAQEMTQQAIRQTPWDGALRYQLARIYQRMGRAKEAQQEFETGERLKRMDQSSIQTLLQLSEAIRLNQRDEAMKLRASVLNQSRSDPDILTWLGALLGRGGFYSEALEPLNKAVALTPDSFEPCYNLGLTLARLGQEQKAEPYLKKALELRPESAEANILLGVILSNQGRNREAIERLRKARQSRPDNVNLLALLGQQYLQGWYVQDAIQTFQEALRLKPDDLKVRYLLIEAYQNASAFEKALQEAQETVKFSPRDPRAHYEVGHQMANLGRYQDARPYFEEAISLDPNFVAAYSWLGDVEFRKGDYESALRNFEKAKSLDPSSVDAARGIGRSLIRLKQYPRALAELEKSIATHPEDAELYLQLSQVQARLGKSKESAEANATFQRLHAAEVQNRDAQRPRSFAPEAQAQVR